MSTNTTINIINPQSAFAQEVTVDPAVFKLSGILGQLLEFDDDSIVDVQALSDEAVEFSSEYMCLPPSEFDTVGVDVDSAESALAPDQKRFIEDFEEMYPVKAALLQRFHDSREGFVQREDFAFKAMAIFDFLGITEGIRDTSILVNEAYNVATYDELKELYPSLTPDDFEVIQSISD